MIYELNSLNDSWLLFKVVRGWGTYLNSHHKIHHKPVQKIVYEQIYFNLLNNKLKILSRYEYFMINLDRRVPIFNIYVTIQESNAFN